MPTRAAQPETICVVGAGYVGLTTAVCLADAGHHVRLVEIDEARLAALRARRSPIHERGLGEALTRVMVSGHLSVGGSVADGVDNARVALIAVGTPPTPDGGADLSSVRMALTQLCAAAEADTVLAIKSTVPPGSTARLQASARRDRHRFRVVACPEFLREGNALEDFENPARIVVGGDDREACERVAAIFPQGEGTRRILTDSTSAELIKYGSNAFLALKISFINELAYLSEPAGADIEAIADGVGSDPRIGRAFLNAGLGFGGSCFPKDVRALEETALYHGQSFWLLKAAIEVNAQQRRRFIAKIASALRGRVAGKRIALLGLAFKPGTDDMRQAASIDIARHLADLGAHVSATDPVAIETARAVLPGVQMVADPYECLTGAHVAALITEWPELRELDWERVAGLMGRRVVVDGRNCLDAERLVAAGFTYVSMGRPVQRGR